MAILPKGFDVIIDMHKRLNKPTYTTSEIVDEFIKHGKTSGAASGTMTRAQEHNLLKKHGYGIYSVNPQYQASTSMASSSSVKINLKNCIESAIQDINKKFPISTVITMNENESDILKKTIGSLQKIIDELS
ncbi:MAG: hypothetical protein K2I80_08280 [Ruminococcus sp.]|nr:hypothetical protein [Ruminococcus sp.]